ncbi:MAG: hypothetical protein JXJ19_04890 [Elusimicrobia bacterium]|nr:hypothetical protein [Elusimicrobiota bacterium]
MADDDDINIGPPEEEDEKKPDIEDIEKSLREEGGIDEADRENGKKPGEDDMLSADSSDDDSGEILSIDKDLSLDPSINDKMSGMPQNEDINLDDPLMDKDLTDILGPRNQSAEDELDRSIDDIISGGNFSDLIIDGENEKPESGLPDMGKEDVIPEEDIPADTGKEEDGYGLDLGEDQQADAEGPAEEESGEPPLDGLDLESGGSQEEENGPEGETDGPENDEEPALDGLSGIDIESGGEKEEEQPDPDEGKQEEEPSPADLSDIELESSGEAAAEPGESDEKDAGAEENPALSDLEELGEDKEEPAADESAEKTSASGGLEDLDGIMIGDEEASGGEKDEEEPAARDEDESSQNDIESIDDILSASAAPADKKEEPKKAAAEEKDPGYIPEDMEDVMIGEENSAAKEKPAGQKADGGTDIPGEITKGAEMKSGKKKGKSSVFLIVLLVLAAAGGAYYYFYMGGKKSAPAVKAVEKPVTASREDEKPADPYVYTGVNNFQRDINEGLVTYVYKTDAPLDKVYEYYKNKMISMKYTLKTDKFEQEDKYAHIVFTKNEKDCSILIISKDGKVSAVISFVR